MTPLPQPFYKRVCPLCLRTIAICEVHNGNVVRPETESPISTKQPEGQSVDRKQRSMFGGAYGDARMPNWPHWHHTPLPGIATTGMRRDKGEEEAEIAPSISKKHTKKVSRVRVT